MKIYDDKSRVASERNIWIKRGFMPWLIYPRSIFFPIYEQ